MEVPFDSLRTAIGPPITRSNWHDAVRRLGHSSNYPPDQRVTLLTLRARRRSTWPSVSSRRLGPCGRISGRSFSALGRIAFFTSSKCQMIMGMIELLANLNKINPTIHATTRTVPKSKGAGAEGTGSGLSGLPFAGGKWPAVPDLAGKFPDPLI